MLSLLHNNFDNLIAEISFYCLQEKTEDYFQKAFYSHSFWYKKKKKNDYGSRVLCITGDTLVLYDVCMSEEEKH